LACSSERAAHDAGVAAKLAFPETVAENHEIAAVRHVLLRREGAAQKHARAKETEVRLAHMDAVDLLRNRAGKVQALAAKVIRRHILHHAGLRLPDVELGGRSSRKFAIPRSI
jgi:hypothetical protein